MKKQAMSSPYCARHFKIKPLATIILGALALQAQAFGATVYVDIYGTMNISVDYVDSDFSTSLIEARVRGVQAGVGLPNLALFGAHHRSLLDSSLVSRANGACVWATADAARHNSTDTRMELAEVGACKDIGSTRLGIGIGQAWALQDWSLGGGAKYDGQYLIAEAANAFGNGMEGSLTGYYGRFDTEMRRNYMNGTSVDHSTGKPDAKSIALRVRLDWKNVAKLGQFSLSPYAAYTWMETKLDAYTESGGGFPAQFSADAWRTNDLRIGAAAKTALSGSTDLRLELGAARHFDGSTKEAPGFFQSGGSTGIS